ncbi:heterokaryon incompatibility protein-domain-containing protein [Bombardia bombarda]|uniref:Heterokaryon incompatibility protein-domain-containing protein n=1 Tax=Bombardia bombarda TaxID=252184 RepID=A0AA40BVT6_9PEZI|nr:heterokaryon incompatibility protein-domain-containing protein [Bombardia bombarda]
MTGNPIITIEEFKRKVAALEKQIVSSTTRTHTQIDIPRLCNLCQPVGDRLVEIIHAQDKSDLYGGSRDSTGNIIIGDLDHVMSNAFKCSLCALVTRLVLRLKQRILYSGIGPALAVQDAITLFDVNAALKASAGLEADGGPSSGNTSNFGEEEEDDLSFGEQDDGSVQVSVDAIPHTGAISVWLPLEQSDEENDEESQFFLHVDDYGQNFGKPPEHVFIPTPCTQASRDMGMIKRCFAACRKHHPGCVDILNHAKRPTRLIDVIDMKLVATVTLPDAVLTGFEYFALSYVWGTDPVPMLKTSSVLFFEAIRALEHASITLPKTIVDAINVTRSFGVRYLWVDSLCIIQDDKEDKMSEISAMDQIYAGAALTIVAATGSSANASLMDIDSFVLSSKYVTMEDLRFDLDRPEFQPTVEFSTWATRGWTLQELICSNRLLYFTPERTYYSCKAGNWNEDFPFNASIPLDDDHDRHLHDDDPKGLGFATVAGGKSNTASSSTSYLTMVEKLSMRNFTLDEDVLNASLGMYRMCIGKGLGLAASGLPILHLEAALMWQPDGRLRRRGSKFPTWSWAAWAGPIIYPFFELDRLESRPLVSWHLYHRDLIPPVLGLTVGSQRYHDLERSLLQSAAGFDEGLSISNLVLPDDEISRDMFRSNANVPVANMGHVIQDTVLVCRAATRLFAIRTQAHRTKNQTVFFSICSPSSKRPEADDANRDHESELVMTGEIKTDTGTLEAFGLDESCAKHGPEHSQNAELLSFASLDFSTPRLSSVMYLNRHSQREQFSTGFMDLAERDPDVVAVMWIVRSQEAQLKARRVAVGYMSKRAWDEDSGSQEYWIVLE